MSNHFGWRSCIRNLYVGNAIDDDADSDMVHSEEWIRKPSRPQLMQPIARKIGVQPAVEYIPDSFRVIGNWETDKLWYWPD